MAELEYISQYEGTEIDAAVGFGKSPDVRPTEGSEGGAESGGIYTFTQEQINANKVNRNLLHNPYFRIDQRQGQIAPPNTDYYSDTALTTLVGQTSEYVTVTAKASGYNTINIGGTNYYVAVADCVRGYVGSGMIRINDRYTMYTTHPDVGLILINDDGSITATHLSGTRDIVIAQNAPDELKKEIRGKTVTLSVIANGDEYTRSWTIPESGTGSGGNIYPTNKSGTSYEIADGYCYYRFWLSPSGTLTVSTVKLEHGPISTIEAEIASGAYDYDADLRACQEYLFPQDNTWSNAKYVGGSGLILTVPARMKSRPDVINLGQVNQVFGDDNQWADITALETRKHINEIDIVYSHPANTTLGKNYLVKFSPMLSCEL